MCAGAITFHLVSLRVLHQNFVGIFFIYLTAIVVAAWCGYGPGVLVALLISCGSPFLFRPGFSLTQIPIGGIISYLLVSLLISHTSEVRRKTEARLRELNQDLDERVRERTTELAQANRDLESTRDSLKATLASIGDAVISTDTQGRVIFANAVALGLLKMREPEVVGRDLREIFRILNEYTREVVESPVTKVLREGVIVGLANHSVLLASDGTEVPIDDSGAPIRSADGKLQGTVLVFRDITVRRRADQVRQLLASIVENSEDAIISEDLTGTVTSWNRAAEKLFGYTADEMIGQSITRIADESRGNEMSEILARIQKGERIEQFETVRRTKSGDRINVSVTMSPIFDSAGRAIGASKISRDITERVRAAERLESLNAELRRTNEILAAANQDLERFAFIASHDLQEPLRMVTAYSQLLVKSFSGPLDENAKRFVGYISDGTERMRALLTDLLAYAEIRKEDEETWEVVNLNSVIEEVRRNLEAAIEESGATILVDVLPQVRGHSRHLQSVFHNLISNAIKYRAEAPLRVQVSARTVSDELRFEVTDNGIGIDPVYHKQIFEVFRRLHSRDIPGSGVGLSICQRVVEKYGGEIGVESQVGRGSTFWFTLPRTAVSAATFEEHS